MAMYGEILAGNIRAARSRKGLGQATVAERMRALGHQEWRPQTVSSTEKARRRVTAEEIFALSLVIEVSIAALMAPADEDKVINLPTGEEISVAAVQMSAHGVSESDVRWEGDVPVFVRGGPHPPSWLADKSYMQDLQQARRRRAWEMLSEEEQAAKLETTLALQSGASGEDLADLADPGVKIKPLDPDQEVDVFRLRQGDNEDGR